MTPISPMTPAYGTGRSVMKRVCIIRLETGRICNSKDDVRAIDLNVAEVGRNPSQPVTACAKCRERMEGKFRLRG
jgi:hypothetical protein